jgi:3-hydroxyisobutyrate dehydrogenase-like beta-hydroxyacid dehydrogenase
MWLISVIEPGFKGYYLDANAISPQRAINIGQRMEANGIRFIDGGIIGGPAWKPGETWLYLSGARLQNDRGLFFKGTA